MLALRLLAHTPYVRSSIYPFVYTPPFRYHTVFIALHTAISARRPSPAIADTIGPGRAGVISPLVYDNRSRCPTCSLVLPPPPLALTPHRRPRVYGPPRIRRLCHDSRAASACRSRTRGGIEISRRRLRKGVDGGCGACPCAHPGLLHPHPRLPAIQHHPSPAPRPYP